MSERPDEPAKAWHRDSLPWWGWLGMALLRIGALLSAVLPLALFLALGWLWLYWRDPAVVAWVSALRALVAAATAAVRRVVG